MTFKSTFGTWLRSQMGRHDQIGELAEAFDCFLIFRKRSKKYKYTAKDFKMPSDFYPLLDYFEERYRAKLIYITAYSAAKEYSSYRRGVSLKILLPRQSYNDTLQNAFLYARNKNLKRIRYCIPGQWDRYPCKSYPYLDL